MSKQEVAWAAKIFLIKGKLSVLMLGLLFFCVCVCMKMKELGKTPCEPPNFLLFLFLAI